MLIGGKWVEADAFKLKEILNPAYGQAIGTFVIAGQDEVNLAVAAARKAFDKGKWSLETPASRARLLWKVADLIDTHADELPPLWKHWTEESSIQQGRARSMQQRNVSVITQAGVPR